MDKMPSKTLIILSFYSQISNYRELEKKTLVCNFFDNSTLRWFFLKRVIKECHSLNWERRRSATPFFQKERCGSGTPFLRAGAGAERHSKNMGALNTLEAMYILYIECHSEAPEVIWLQFFPIQKKIIFVVFAFFSIIFSGSL